MNRIIYFYEIYDKTLRMENPLAKSKVISFNNESFRNYLLLNHMSRKWEYLSLLPAELISTQTWIKLHNQARENLAKKGSELIGYELIDNEIISHETIASDSWPEHWMWVIKFSAN